MAVDFPVPVRSVTSVKQMTENTLQMHYIIRHLLFVVEHLCCIHQRALWS